MPAYSGTPRLHSRGSGPRSSAMQMEVSLIICTKMVGTYLKFGRYPFCPYSPVLGQHDKLLEPHCRKQRTQVMVNAIKYFFIACSYRYNRLVSVSTESPSIKKSLQNAVYGQPRVNVNYLNYFLTVNLRRGKAMAIYS
jgi:hypothetical protein